MADSALDLDAFAELVLDERMRALREWAQRDEVNRDQLLALAEMVERGELTGGVDA